MTTNTNNWKLILIANLIIYNYYDLVECNLDIVTKSVTVDENDVIRLLVVKRDSNPTQIQCTFTSPNYKHHTDSLKIPGIALQITKGDTQELSYPTDNNGVRNRPNDWKYKWYGENIDRDCGIEINEANLADYGNWSFTFDGISGSIPVNVNKPPAAITRLDIDEIENDVFEYTINDPNNNDKTVDITCKSLSSRPIPDVSFGIGDQVITDQNKLKYTITTNTLDQNMLDASFTLKYLPQTHDDNKELRCIFFHPSWDEKLEINSNQFVINLSIKSPPNPEDYESFFQPELVFGKSTTIRVRFHSNPSPEWNHVYWKPHDLEDELFAGNFSTSKPKSTTLSADVIKSVSSVTTFGRYSARTINLGNNDYEAQLTIDSLKDYDQGKSIEFGAGNSLGVEKKSFTIPHIKSKLVGGEIAGIVIGVLIFIALIAGIIFILYKMKLKKQKPWNRHPPPPPSSAAPRMQTFETD